MAGQRCKETSFDSFFGNFLYEQKVPRDHFLRQVNEVVDWDRFTPKLLSYYPGKGEVGQAPYNPVLVLKMLLLSYLYSISERQVEVLANDSLSVAYFLGLGADERAPDHATLTLFKNRLLEAGGQKAYQELFEVVIRQAQEKGIKFGKLQIVDSVHVVADVNADKDRTRQRKGIEVEVVAADRGYDDGENHYFLEQKGIKGAIRLRSFRTQKKDHHKEGWLRLQRESYYQEGLKRRPRIEGKFGEMKQWHGFGRCRYVGMARHAIQLFLTSIAVNLKRLVKLLSGISFKAEVRPIPIAS